MALNEGVAEFSRPLCFLEAIAGFGAFNLTNLKSAVLTGITDKVLVVDDDLSVHRLVEAVLLPVGVQVHCMTTAEDAAKAMIFEKPAVLVIDGLLPGMRGDEL